MQRTWQRLLSMLVLSPVIAVAQTPGDPEEAGKEAAQASSLAEVGGSAAPTVDAAEVRDCFVQMGQGAVGDCIGLAADACQQSPGGPTTLGIVDCLAQETRVWDELLNAQYQELRALMREQDEGNPDVGISRVDALRDVQRAWITFRDAECGYAYARYQDGTIRSVVAAACQLEQTAQRALTLKGILHESSL
ncbi:MAG: DUF1311 domain-containing protein [Gammaproteobacteria bacterium]|uniref:lysozyme inhibitor LprI family protein n=1 Tax=Halomonas sp. EF61 TaxID=2950869 RepID=UPI0032DF79E7|nr:DUF1311 domain-containing protein [Gammaproteobacteria bacterium]